MSVSSKRVTEPLLPVYTYPERYHKIVDDGFNSQCFSVQLKQGQSIDGYFDTCANALKKLVLTTADNLFCNNLFMLVIIRRNK